MNRTIEAVGEDYLLALGLGVPFFDYIALPRAGGLEQGIFDLMEHEAFFEKLHEEYIAWMRRVARVQNNQ